MSASFIAGSSQGLLNSSPPVTAAPYTMALWFNMPTGASEQGLFSLNGTSTGHHWLLYKSTSNIINVFATDGATNVFLNTSTAITSNRWAFVVFREILATNHKLSVLHATGLIEHASDTTSNTPASIDTMGLGYRAYGSPDDYMTGFLAEFALWNVDVQADGAQLQNRTLRQMAFGGPFSMQHVLGNLVEYRSFRAGLISVNDRPNEIYVGAGKPRQGWTNTGGAILGKHVPLPGSYVRQFQGSRLMPVL